MAASSAEEAAALMKSAERHSQKKLFRRPDWDTAASEYEKAAKIYTYLEDTARASDAWRKASGAHQEAENKFFAARAMESLAVFLTEQARKGVADKTFLLSNAVEAYCETSKLYALNDMFDRQADCLKKAAQIISPATTTATTTLTGLSATEADRSQLQQERQQKMQQVVGFFREGVSVLEEHIEDKPLVATQLPELYRSWMLTHLHGGDVKGAVEVLEEQLGIRTDPHKKGVFERLAQPHRSAKVGLEIIVLCLSCGDDVWARQEMNKLRGVPGFPKSKEEATANALISSFEERDEEQLQVAVKDQTLQFITIDISRMSRNLKIQFSTPQRTNMAPSSLRPHPLSNEQQQGESQQDLELDPEEDIRNRPTLDAESYLRRRVAEIVYQIQNASSAHHFYRHVVEIDELLRCDAPMGFTPSMVLAGVPDILYMLCDAVKQGYLPYPMELENSRVQALTPLRRSPVATASIGTTLHAATAAASMGIFAGSLTPQTVERDERKKPRCCVSSKGGPRSRVKNEMGGGDVAVDDLLPFLPPLLHRPVPLTSTTALPGGAEDEFAVSAGADSRRRTTVRLQSQQIKLRPGEKLPRPHKPKGTRMSTASSAMVCSSRSLMCFGVSPERQHQHQQQQQQTERSEREVSDGSLIPHIPILRDIPSALQALLYHCALPLVCLTPEDQRQRTTAVRTLASAMASMLQLKPDCMHANPTAGPGAEADAANAADGVDHSEGDGQKRDAPATKFQEISFRIRHAALISLNALMTHLDAEELTCVNQHFAPHDKRKYEETDIAQLPHISSWKARNQLGITNGQSTEGTSLLTNSQQTGIGALRSQVFRLTDSYKAPRESSRAERTPRTVPMSIYNGAVAVDVFVPLIERWTVILRDDVAENALLDSSRLLFQHPALVQAGGIRTKKDTDENKGVVVTPTTGFHNTGSPSLLKELKGLCAFVSKKRMEEVEAEEIYLLLLVCLHLSTYKQHARYLIAPDTSSTATYTSLPVLLCLTMARCAEGDKCLSLCVECMWNLLEVVPEETVSAILRHSGQCEGPKGSEKSRPLSSLSACESLLSCFVHVLLTGHRLRQRELRNDMVVLLMMILNTGTAALRNQKKEIQNSTGAAAYTPLPTSTIHAINAIAKTIFGMVCGPELHVNGETAQMTQHSEKNFLRYHTVLSPTTRVENLQFKVLGWRMLEAFCEWQEARLAVEYLCRKPEYSTRDVEPGDSIHSHDGVEEQVGADDCLVFDVCRHGLIDVLLLYVDLMCSDEAVVSWTREELLTLQEEAWLVILGLMESAVLSAPSPSSQDNTGGNDMSVLTMSGGARSNTPEDNVMARLPLVKVDTQFIAAGGISRAVRYIREVTAKDAEAIMSLAVRVLSVLSRRPEHRPELLAAKTIISPLASSLSEGVPLLLVVIMHVIESVFQRISATEVLPLAVASTKSEKHPKSAIHSSNTCHSGRIMSTGSGAGNSLSVMRGGGTAEQSQQHGESRMRPSFIAAGPGATPENNGKEKDRFTAFEFDVVIHCLSLLNNIVGGEAAGMYMTQQAFLSLGGVPLLLSLARILLTALRSISLPHSKGNGSGNELLLAVLDCFRAFVLGNEEAQRQFVYEDGVHVLLSIIVVLVDWRQSNSMKDHDATVTEDDILLAPALTILADLLHESGEAQEAFLQWSTYRPQNSEDMEDNNDTNATQLLLRLWEEEGEYLEPMSTSTSPQGPTNWGASTEGSNAPNRRNSENGAAMDGLEEEKEGRGSNGEAGSVAEEKDFLAKDVHANDGGRNESVALPIFHADQWGLGLIGIHDRKSLKAELQRRYNELERATLDAAHSGMEPDAIMQRARRRLAASLHSVLGMHAKVYACLAAVGFNRLIHVKTNAVERVKLLHAAALPSLCEDEVWGAIAELVDLRAHAVVIPAHRNGNDQVGGGAETASPEEFLVNPIIPDADQLVRVLLDVEARTTELKHLSKVCVDTHMAHGEEATQRFLLARLRQGTESANVMSLVQQARTRQNPGITGRAGSILDHVMSRVGQRDMDRMDPPTTSSSPPMCTAMTSSGGFLTPRLTLLEKRRKRDAMIRSSFRRRQFSGLEEMLVDGKEM